MDGINPATDNPKTPPRNDEFYIHRLNKEKRAPNPCSQPLAKSNCLLDVKSLKAAFRNSGYLRQAFPQFKLKPLVLQRSYSPQPCILTLKIYQTRAQIKFQIDFKSGGLIQ